MQSNVIKHRKIYYSACIIRNYYASHRGHREHRGDLRLWKKHLCDLCVLCGRKLQKTDTDWYKHEIALPELMDRINRMDRI